MKPERDSNPGVEEAVGLGLPTWTPEWARRLAELYFSGTTSAFVLTGNIFDPIAVGEGDQQRFDHLPSFLAEQLFGSWDLVFHYDLAGGLRCMAGSDSERLREMVALANRKYGDFQAIPRDPAKTLTFLDKVVRKNLMAKEGEQVSMALVLDHASYIVPRAEPGQLSIPASTNLVTLVNWATSPYVKRLNMAVILVDPTLAALNDRLTGNAHVATIEIAMPTREERSSFLTVTDRALGLAKFSDYGIDELAELTAGISLSDLDTMVRSAKEAGRRLDAGLFRSLKKRLLERQAEGLLEFIEPRWTLEMVVGHEAAKRRLSEDAQLLGKGLLDTLPMGYLLCGPVGTGKSFLAQCTSGSLGVPCVVLKNFRSKYVGETEGNLEKVLSVLRAMGPVVVIIDEADAMLGDRGADGDSGTSSRVFAMIAAQMGDTRYRGRILWMLLTCRPDLLPIDLKRQGRAEVHIPMFYPTEESEIRDLFVVLAKKLGATLRPEDVPPIPHVGDLSGADIEGIVGRAQRAAILASHRDGGEGAKARITKEILDQAVGQFMPSTQSLERKLQETAAIVECTDREFLPPSIAKQLEEAGGRAKLQERLTALKQLVESL
ncbi:MAG: ATP-binding protein [Planctomycetes bacterium]|nr:ATP-binding protein [Planctomycetota bacterium]